MRLCAGDGSCSRGCGGMEGTSLMFGELIGSAGSVGAGKRVEEVSPGRPQNFRYRRQPMDDCVAQSEGECGKTVEPGVERFMAKWIAEEKARTGLRHAVVYPNVTGRTKDRISQSKRARDPSSLVFYSRLATSSAKLYLSGVSFADAMPYSLSLALRCRFLCLTSFRFRLLALVKSAALRPIALRYTCASAATRNHMATRTKLYFSSFVLFLF